MRPRADEIVQSITWTFEEHIVPDLKDPLAKSLSLTLGYLLRHVEQRIRDEGPALHADIREIRQALRSVQDLLQRTPAIVSDPDLSRLSQEIAAVLGRQYRLPDEYPRVESLMDEADALGWVLVQVIKALEGAKDKFPEAPYRTVRQEIRTYLANHLRRQAAYVYLSSGRKYAYAGLDPLAGRI